MQVNILYASLFSCRAVEKIIKKEVKQKEKEKQAIFDALPDWKKRLMLEKSSS